MTYSILLCPYKSYLTIASNNIGNNIMRDSSSDSARDLLGVVPTSPVLVYGIVQYISKGRKAVFIGAMMYGLEFAS